MHPAGWRCPPAGIEPSKCGAGCLWMSAIRIAGTESRWMPLDAALEALRPSYRASRGSPGVGPASDERRRGSSRRFRSTTTRVLRGGMGWDGCGYCIVIKKPHGRVQNRSDGMVSINDDEGPPIFAGSTGYLTGGLGSAILTVQEGKLPASNDEECICDAMQCRNYDRK